MLDFRAFADTKADSRLDLTPAQSELYRPLIENLLTKGLEERPRNKQLPRDLAAAIRQDTVDAEQPAGFLERKSEIMQTIMTSGIDDFIVFHSSLSPEQRNKLADVVLELGDKTRQGKATCSPAACREGFHFTGKGRPGICKITSSRPCRTPLRAGKDLASRGPNLAGIHCVASHFTRTFPVSYFPSLVDKFVVRSYGLTYDDSDAHCG